MIERADIWWEATDKYNTIYTGEMDSISPGYDGELVERNVFLIVDKLEPPVDKLQIRIRWPDGSGSLAKYNRSGDKWTNEKFEAVMSDDDAALIWLCIFLGLPIALFVMAIITEMINKR